jgi:uncharacterized membrane protein
MRTTVRPPRNTPAVAHPVEAVRRLPHEIRRVARADTRAHELFRDRIVVLAFYTFAIWVICSIAMYFFERHARGTDIHNGWQAAYWTASQMTTVGSSFANPISTPAYVLDVLLKLYAVVIVASLAGTVGAFFVHRQRQGEQDQP